MPVCWLSPVRLSIVSQVGRLDVAAAARQLNGSALVKAAASADVASYPTSVLMAPDATSSVAAATPSSVGRATPAGLRSVRSGSGGSNSKRHSFTTGGSGGGSGAAASPRSIGLRALVVNARVADNGVGLDAEGLARLFARFSQVRTHTLSIVLA
jgi:hypothetical protein